MSLIIAAFRKIQMLKGILPPSDSDRGEFLLTFVTVPLSPFLVIYTYVPTMLGSFCPPDLGQTAD